MSKKNILIAGGAGYIGSKLVPVLINKGYKITVLDLFWFGNNLPNTVNIINKNISEATIEDVKGFDICIFLAGLSNDPMAEFSPSMNFTENAAMPAYLAYICKNALVKKFIYAGSCSVYGYTKDRLYNEEDPTICNYPYGMSKLQGEFGVSQLNDENFQVISFRQGTVSGYSPRMRLDLVVNTMFKCGIKDKKITVNNPEIWRPILSIDDVTSAYVKAIECGKSVSGTFNIASGNHTIGDIADKVKHFIESNFNIDLELNILAIKDHRNYKVTCEKAKNILGFIPKYNTNDILKTLADNLESFSNLDNPKYYNIEVFKKMK